MLCTSTLTLCSSVVCFAHSISVLLRLTDLALSCGTCGRVWFWISDVSCQTFWVVFVCERFSKQMAAVLFSKFLNAKGTVVKKLLGISTFNLWCGSESFVCCHFVFKCVLRALCSHPCSSHPHNSLTLFSLFLLFTLLQCLSLAVWGWHLAETPWYLIEKGPIVSALVWPIWRSRFHMLHVVKDLWFVLLLFWCFLQFLSACTQTWR